MKCGSEIVRCLSWITVWEFQDVTYIEIQPYNEAVVNSGSNTSLVRDWIYWFINLYQPIDKYVKIMCTLVSSKTKFFYSLECVNQMKIRSKIKIKHFDKNFTMCQRFHFLELMSKLLSEWNYTITKLISICW